MPEVVERVDECGRLRERRHVRVDGGVEVRHGAYESWHENGVLASRGQYLDGEKDGLWEEYHADGAKFAEKAFARGVAHGRWMNYYLDGRPKCERWFVDGVEHGTRTTWYTHLYWVEEYAGGHKHGLALELDMQGKLIRQRRYVHGNEV